MDIVPRLESRIKSLEKELSETKQTLGTAILQLIRIKKLENKLRKEEERIKKLRIQRGKPQEEQISPSTLEVAQILTNVASEGFKGSQAPLGSKIYKRKSKSYKTPTKNSHFEEPDSAQVNAAQVNTAELNPDSTPSAQVNTGEVNAAEVNTGEAERIGRAQEKLARRLYATDLSYIQARLNAYHILADKRFNKKKGSNILLRKEQQHAALNSKSFRGAFKYCMRDIRSKIRRLWHNGSEEDKKRESIKKMNEKDMIKRKIKKDELFMRNSRRKKEQRKK
ncbi:hypothetical protein Tco_0613157 [Tanacetum coccineum]